MSDDILRHLAKQDAILARLDERTEFMADKFTTIDKRLDSHAVKIRDLERVRNIAAGFGALAAAIAGYLKLNIRVSQ